MSLAELTYPVNKNIDFLCNIKTMAMQSLPKMKTRIDGICRFFALIGRLTGLLTARIKRDSPLQNALSYNALHNYSPTTFALFWSVTGWENVGKQFRAVVNQYNPVTFSESGWYTTRKPVMSTKHTMGSPANCGGNFLSRRVAAAEMFETGCFKLKHNGRLGWG
jgi:hypothetical protein